MENAAKLMDDYREEIIGGEIVMMAPARMGHYRVARNIDQIFENYLRGKPCEYYRDGVGVFLSEDNMFIPDGMVVCDESKVTEDGIMGAPDLVIEILSPSTASNDRIRKKAAYEKHGVKEYWIVSVESRSVEVYLLEGERLELAQVYTLAPALPVRNKLEQEKMRLLAKEFHCSLFPDLLISLEAIFTGVSK